MIYKIERKSNFEYSFESYPQIKIKNEGQYVSTLFSNNRSKNKTLVLYFIIYELKRGFR